MTTPNYTRLISYNRLHYLNKRATPNEITVYKHALLLHKTYNNLTMSIDWTNLFFNQHFNARYNLVKFFNTSKYKIGNNILANRFIVLNGKIDFDCLNETFETYKIKCKQTFLPS